MTQHEIAQDEIVFIGTPGQLEAYRDQDTIDMRDIAKFPLAITPGFHQLIAARLRDENLELQSEMEISSTPIVADIVRRGNHCSVIGSSFVHDDVAQGLLRALRFKGPPGCRRIVLAWPSNRPPSLALDSVKQLVTDEVRNLGVTMS